MDNNWIDLDELDENQEWQPDGSLDDDLFYQDKLEGDD